MNILALNAGSSTLKYKLFAMPDEQVLAGGSLDHPGGAGIAEAAGAAIEECRAYGIDAIAHRMVHGGSRFIQPERATLEMLSALRSLHDLDPLHNPTEVAMIEAGLRLASDAPAVVVFDTAFHQTLPAVASSYALPSDETERHNLRRYGFHGISYRYVSQSLLECIGREPQGTKLVICHLGNGASVCAVEDGRSIDTSMGMTPLEGLIMGTRSGDVDPGLLLYLQRTERMTARQLDAMLNDHSGLLGVSGLSGDVRDLERAAHAGDERSELALAMFAYRVRKYIGAYAAVLGGLDAVAFTGGIGQHSATMRARICGRLGFLGMTLDAAANASTTGETPRRIDNRTGVSIWVIPTNEELEIARECYGLLVPKG